MNRLTLILLVFFALVGSGKEASAFDLNTLDQVSVLMSRTKVHSLLGSPQSVTDAGDGLKVEIYEMSGAEGIVGAACLYDERARLAGQVFVFNGHAVKPAAARLVELGFRLFEEKGDIVRLEGNDDDTGHPIVAIISETLGRTTVVTFERAFYDAFTR